MCPKHHIHRFSHIETTSVQNFRAIGQILITNQILGDTKCYHEHLLGII